MEVNPEIVYVDGSCHEVNDEVICSVGVFWGDGNQRNRSYRVSCSTNNQAELLAAHIAIKQALELGVSRLIIKTDSQYVQRIFTRWIGSWKSNGWVTVKRKPIKNKQYIQEIEKMLVFIDVKFQWEPGHDVTNKGNRSAHRLAEVAARDPSTVLYRLE